MPDNIPVVSAITFFIDPQSSTPTISRVASNLNKLLQNACFIILIVNLFLEATDTPAGISFIKSIAKLGPDITPIFFVLIFFLTISFIF